MKLFSIETFGSLRGLASEIACTDLSRSILEGLGFTRMTGRRWTSGEAAVAMAKQRNYQELKLPNPQIFSRGWPKVPRGHSRSINGNQRG